MEITMHTSNQVKERSSRALTDLLYFVYESCKQGDIEIAEYLGLSMDTIRSLDKLESHQVNGITQHYMKGKCALELFNIDTDKLGQVIENVASVDRQQEKLVDEYLKRGASNQMLQEMFGLRSTQVASRKRLLGIETARGRKAYLNEEDERLIFDSWLANLKIADERERYLVVSYDTNINLALVFKAVSEIKEMKEMKSFRKQKIA